MDNVATCSRFDVEYYPTIMMIKDGQFQIYNGSLSLPSLREYADNRGSQEYQWRKMPEGGSIAFFFIFLKELKVAAVILYGIALENPILSAVLLVLFIILGLGWLALLHFCGRRLFEGKPYEEYSYERQGDSGIIPRSSQSKSRRRKVKIE